MRADGFSVQLSIPGVRHGVADGSFACYAHVRKSGRPAVLGVDYHGCASDSTVFAVRVLTGTGATGRAPTLRGSVKRDDHYD